MLVVFIGERRSSGKELLSKYTILKNETQLASSAWMIVGPYGVPVANSSSSDTVEYGG